MAAHHRQLQEWAEHCPENFANRAALSPPKSRVSKAELDAERLYEQAIRSARPGLVHNEAIAYECAAASTRRADSNGLRCLFAEARQSYLRWGADGKVRQLERLYPQLRKEELTPAQEDDRGARRTPRSRNRDQGLASYLERDRLRSCSTL